ncbi:hypothetical protein F4678DRAFT_224120 [Xylaria arbuscula]|nr:hypothetical protein F4678DRAFT_224120 [Xylaria arbuscula]
MRPCAVGGSECPVIDNAGSLSNHTGRPTCMQCVNAAQPCQYPDQHKRGLPAGFLNAMESRLRETEDALFYALSELYEGTVEHRTYAGFLNSRLGQPLSLSAASKTDMMERWTNFPLGNRAQVKAWFLSYRTGDPLSPPAQVELPSASQASSSLSSLSPSSVSKSVQAGPSRGDTTLQSSRPAAMPSQPFSQSQEMNTFVDRPTATVPSLTSVASTSDDLGLSNRVKAIADSHRKIYF